MVQLGYSWNGTYPSGFVLFFFSFVCWWDKCVFFFSVPLLESASWSPGAVLVWRSGWLVLSSVAWCLWLDSRTRRLNWPGNTYGAAVWHTGSRTAAHSRRTLRHTGRAVRVCRNGGTEQHTHRKGEPHTGKQGTETQTHTHTDARTVLHYGTKKVSECTKGQQTKRQGDPGRLSRKQLRFICSPFWQLHTVEQRVWRFGRCLHVGTAVWCLGGACREWGLLANTIAFRERFNILLLLWKIIHFLVWNCCKNEALISWAKAKQSLPPGWKRLRRVRLTELSNAWNA